MKSIPPLRTGQLSAACPVCRKRVAIGYSRHVWWSLHLDQYHERVFRVFRKDQGSLWGFDPDGFRRFRDWVNENRDFVTLLELT